jgi:hypothetical protein
LTIQRMRIECYIPKATNTHLDYVIIFCFSTATMVARTSLIVTFYTHCLFFFFFFFCIPCHMPKVAIKIRTTCYFRKELSKEFNCPTFVYNTNEQIKEVEVDVKCSTPSSRPPHPSMRCGELGQNLVCVLAACNSARRMKNE